MTKDDQLTMARVHGMLSKVLGLLDELSSDEGAHGYGSVGAALDKMREKVAEVTRESRWMANDPGRGAQMVRGR